MKATKFSQYLQSREDLKFVDTPHWIYIVEALIWSCIIIAVGIIGNQFIANNFIYPQLNQNVAANGFILNAAAYIARGLLWGSFLMAVIMFLNKLAFWASTYVFASDRRLYMKTGIMRVIVNEVSYDEVRKTDINYGWIGRFLGYGKLIMDARFVEDTKLPFTYSPEKFAKLIHYSNDLDEDINLSYVTDGMKDRADQMVAKQSSVEKQVAPMREQSKIAEQKFAEDEQRENKSDEEIAHDDFENAADTRNKTIDKPCSTAPSKMDV